MTIAELCVKRPVFAVMLVTFLVVLGIFSFKDLGVDLFPKADPPNVNIEVRLPGATPEEITTQVILPLEDAISSISGVDQLDAGAHEGFARINVQFTLERDIESAAQDVREKIAGAMRNLPPTVYPPIITKADPDSDPVLVLIVSIGDSLMQTTEIADKQIRRTLQTVNGVGAVNLYGGRLRQIRIFGDAEKLNAYGITINQLRTAIERQNIEVPGGTIIRGEAQVGVRTLGRVESSDQFENIIVANVNGTPIRVKDVGRVEDSYPDPTNWNSIHGKDAVALGIQRQSGTNTLQVVEAVKAELQRMKRDLPPETKFIFIRDVSTFIKASVASLEEHLLFGALLASLVVLLFLRDLRATIIASLAIPASIIATFTVLKFMDFTLNNMTLLALTLAVGIVIDDAIVVLENIVRYIEEKGYEPKRASIEATKEIMLAVMATTLSLVIIFVPIAFTTGYARRYLNSFGWTMAFSVMVSLLVSLTLTPMLCSRFLKRKDGSDANTNGREGQDADHSKHASKESGFFRAVENSYGRILEWSLDHRAITILVSIGIFGLTFPLNSMVGRDFIPADDQSELNIFFTPPGGTSIYGTQKLMREMNEKIEQVPGVEFSFATIYSPQQVRTYVRLVDASKRKITNLEIADNIRAKLQTIPLFRGITASVVAPSALIGNNGGPGGAGALRAMILGSNFYRVADVAQRAAAEARKEPGLLDVNADVDLNTPELHIKIDRQRAADLGVQAGDVAEAVRLMIAGTDQISTYTEGNEQYDVTMQLLPEQQRNPDVLSRLMIPSSKVGQVRLDNIATIERGIGPAQISRSNRQYRVFVTANNSPDVAFDEAVRRLRGAFAKVIPPNSPFNVRFTGTAKILDETTHSLIIAFLLAAIFMYMVLASQFESFLHPFTIMLSLPLSIPFALLTLYLTHRTLNLWSALGIFLLLGIVKKNGILQVDYTNKLREQGLPLREAIIQANHVRLRPILMTTLSIVAGLIPTALGIGAGAAQRSAIGMTIIGGQSLCLLLTLIVTPVAYSLLASLEGKRFFARSSRRKRMRHAELTPLKAGADGKD